MVLHACRFVLILLSLCSTVVAKTYNIVLDFNAPTNGTSDAAPAFRAAVAQVKLDGGGTIYVPAGTYRMASVDGANTWNVAISSPSVHIVGDGGTAEGGGTLILQAVGQDVFHLHTVVGGAPGGNGDSHASGCSIANMVIGRTFSATSPGAAIRFRTTANNYPFGCQIRNMSIGNFPYGISTTTDLAGAPRGANSRSRLPSLTIQGCNISGCGVDGVYLEDFSDLKVAGCEFKTNVGAGIRLVTYMPSISFPVSHPVGSAVIQGCTMRGNVAAGINCRGETAIIANNRIKDIHITGCQLSGNGTQGFSISQATNVAVSTCTIDSNQGGSGNFIGLCRGVSVTGCTFRANQSRGLYVAASVGVTVASCSFVGNSTSDSAYALEVNGGSTQSYSNLTFETDPADGSGSSQKHGITLSFSAVDGDPKGILIQGANFADNMGAVFTPFQLTSAAKYRIDFLSPQDWTTSGSVYQGVMQFFEQ